MNLSGFKWDQANDLFYCDFADESSIYVFKVDRWWDAEYFPAICSECPLYAFRSFSPDEALAVLAGFLEADGIDPQ